MLGLLEIKTAIQFVSDGSGGGGGGTSPTAQTGDVVFILTAIIALAAIAIGCGIYAFIKSRKFATVGTGALHSAQSHIKSASIAQKLAIAIAILAAICSIGIGVAKAPVLKAFAENDNGVVKVYVNETTGEITSIDDGAIINECETEGDFFIAQSINNVNAEAKDVPGIKNVEMKIESLGGIVFQGKTDVPYVPENNHLIFPYGEKQIAKFSFSNLSAETAKALVGKTAFTTTLTPKNITRIEYDANGATGGDLPTHNPQYYEWNDENPPAITVCYNEGNLAKMGFYFNGWNTQSDGKGDSFAEAASYNKKQSAILYAEWTIHPSNVIAIFSAAKGQYPDGTKSKNITEKVGEKYVLPDKDPSLANKRFTGYFTDLEGGTKITEDDTVMDFEPHVFYAQYEDITKDVTFNANGGEFAPGQTTTQITEIVGNTYIFPTVPSKEYKTFAGWWTADKGGEQILEGAIVDENPPQTLYAHWTDTNVEVTFNANGGTPLTESIIEVWGNTYDLPDNDPELEGKKFVGWWTDSAKGDEVTDETIVLNQTPHTVWAHWVTDTKTITYHGNGAKWGDEDTTQLTLEMGQPYSFPEVPSYSYKFEGWYDAQEGGNAVTTDTIVSKDSPSDVWAHWGIDVQVPVTFYANNETEDSQTVQQVFEANYSFKDVVQPEYKITGWDDAEFDGWWTAKSGGKQITETTKVTTKEAHNLYAHWKMPSVDVHFYATDGKYPGSQSAYETVTETYNSKYVFPATLPQNYGYALEGWYTQAGGQGDKITDQDIVKDASLLNVFANWNVLTFTVKFLPGSGQFPSGRDHIDKEQTYGEDFNLPTETEIGGTPTIDTPGLVFDGWYSEINSGYKIGDKVDNCDIQNLYAGFTGQQLTVTFTAEGLADQQRSEKYLDKYSFEDIEAPSWDNYDFAGWYLEDGVTKVLENTTVVNNYNNHILIAHKSPKVFDVTFDAKEGKFTTSSTVNMKETYTKKYSLPTGASYYGYQLAGWFAVDPDDESLEIRITNETDVNPAISYVYAKWTPVVIETTTFYGNEGKWEDGATSREVKDQVYNTKYKLPDTNPVRYGYDFAGWNTSIEGKGIKIDSDTAITDYTIKSFYAQWTPKTVVATFKAGEGSSWTKDEVVNETFNTLYILPSVDNPTKKGYDFAGWALPDGSTLTSLTKVTDEGPIDITAKWNAKKIDVTFVHNDTMVGIAISTVTTEKETFGEHYILSSTQDYTGWTFKGWYKNQECTGDPVTADTIVDNDAAHVLYGKWEANILKIVYHANGGKWEGHSPDETIWVVDNQRYGSVYSLPIDPTREGYEKVAWYDNEAGTGIPLYSTSICKLSGKDQYDFYMKWNPSKPQVTFDSDGGTPSHQYKVQTFDQRYDFSDIETPGKTGYTFGGWWIDSQQITDETDVKIGTDHTLKAKWNPIAYELTLNTNATPAKIYQIYNTGFYTTNIASEDTEITTEKGIDIPVKEGYSFDGFYTAGGVQILTNEGNLAGGIQNTLFTSNSALDAKWTAKTVDVTFDANGGEFPGGTPQPVKITQTYDSNYILTGYYPTKTVGGDKYAFAGWYDAPESGNKITSETKVSNLETATLYAHYTLVGTEYVAISILYKCDDASIAEPYIATVEKGSTVGPITSPLPKGYSLENEGQATITLTNVQADQNVDVYYTEDEATITYSVSPANSGSTTPSEQTIGAVTGSAMSVANAYDTWKFVNWTAKVDGEDVEVSKNPTFVPPKDATDNIYKDITYTANFQRKDVDMYFYPVEGQGSVNYTELSVPYGAYYKVVDQTINIYQNEASFHAGEDPIYVNKATANAPKYKFSNWSNIEDEGTVVTLVFAVALFEENYTTVTFVSEDTQKGDITVKQVPRVLYGTKYEISEDGHLTLIFDDNVTQTTEIQLKEGYTFDKWTLSDGSDLPEDHQINPGKDSLKVHFKIRDINLNFQLADGQAGKGTIDQSKKTKSVPYWTQYKIIEEDVIEGGDVVKPAGSIDFTINGTVENWAPAIPNTGYHWLKWDLPLEGQITQVFPPISDDSYWNVSFDVNTYQMTYLGKTQKKDETWVDIGSVTVEPEGEVAYNLKYKVEQKKIVIYDGEDVVQTATPDDTDGYLFQKWMMVSGEEYIDVPPVGGTITGEITFIAYYAKLPAQKITYTILDEDNPHGYVSRPDGADRGTSFVEEIEVDAEAAVGAKAYEIPKPVYGGGDNAAQMNPLIYSFLSWTDENGNDVTPEGYDWKSDTFIPQKSATGGWATTTYTAHFATAVALFNEENSTMTFDYSEETYNNNAIYGTVFPVRNDSYVDFETGEFAYPSWYHEDGTAIVYPTSVEINPSFKNYKDLQTTSLWFTSVNLNVSYANKGDSALEDFDPFSKGPEQAIAVSPRQITRITGLNNLYTENLEQANGMFASGGDDARLTDLDLSMWNTPKLKQTFAMFQGNEYLKTIKFPDKPVNESSPRFGEKLENMGRMFCQCRSLTDIALYGNFASTTDDEVNLLAHSMFYHCYNIKTITIEGENFGKNIVNANQMFMYCQNLVDLNVASKTMCSKCEDYNQMFYGCNKLRRVDMSGYKVKNIYDGDGQLIKPAIEQVGGMLAECTNLGEYIIGDNWETGEQGDADMSSTELPYGNNPGELWFRNQEIDEAYLNHDIPSQSGAGSFSKLTAKAVYTENEDKSVGQLTFYYDYETHDGVSFPITETGSHGWTDFVLPEWYDFKLLYDGEEMTFDKADSKGPAAATMPTLPIDVQIHSKLTAPVVNVKFHSSFAKYDQLRSLAYWFIGDSDGYCPYQTFEDFENINTKNVRSVLCMFGGFDYAYNTAMMFAENFGANPDAYDVHATDTYNNNDIKTWGKDYLDLSKFDTYIEDDGEVHHYVQSYAGMFANCSGLTKVKLPSYLGAEAYEEQTDFDWYEGFQFMFDNCRSLKTIEKIETLTTSNQRNLLCMFNNCYSLENLDLSNFDLKNIERYDGYFSWGNINTAHNMLKGCDHLTKLTISNKWGNTIKASDIGLPETWDDTLGENSNPWQYEKTQESGDKTLVPIKTTDFPSNDLFNAQTKKIAFVRDNTKIIEKTIKVVSNDETIGHISPANFEYKYISPVTVGLLGDKLRLDCYVISGIALGENKLKYWEWDENKISSGFFTDPINLIDSDEPVTTITGVFGETGRIAYAVYDETQENNKTLTMYYDRTPHEKTGKIFPIYQEAGLNVKVNLDTETVNFNIIIPSWFKAVKKGVDVDFEAIKKEEVELNSLPQTYNPEEYNFYWRIKPDEVIFDDSFSHNDELKSISCWFMGDSNRTQTIKSFSSIVGTQKEAGFRSLNTSSVNNVAFAFGGLFLQEKAFYDDILHTGGMVHLPTNNWFVNAIGDILNNVFGVDNVSAKLGILDNIASYSRPSDTYGSSITDLDLTTFDFKNIKDASYMLSNCIRLEHVKIDPESTANVQNFTGFFANDEFLGHNESITQPIEGLSSLNTNSALYMDYLFFGCSGLKELNLSSFKTDKVIPYIRIPMTELVGPVSLGMFSDCTRLNKVITNTSFDEKKPFRTTGWTLNMSYSGLEETVDNPWHLKTDSGEGQPVSLMSVPFENINGGPENPSDLISGTLYREAPNECSYIVQSNDPEQGLVDGQEKFTYNIVNNCYIQRVNGQVNTINFDNQYITAEPAEGCEFKYFVFDEGFSEDIKGDVVPYSYSEEFTKEDGPVHIIKAVFGPITKKAQAVYSITESEEVAGEYIGHFEFVCDESDHTNDIGYVTSYNIDPYWDDYNFPAWYNEYGSTSVSGDKHKRPRWNQEVEVAEIVNAEGEVEFHQVSYITINFAESFKDFDNLQSLSCWFMDGLSSYEKNKLYSPFRFDGEHVTGLENIPLNNVNNVKYMFGGHEYFNDINGSKYQSLDLTGFDKDGSLKNTAGLFANCVDLESVTFDTNFSTVNVKDMSYMFYNCQALSENSGDKLSTILSKIDTTNVTNMSYMFGMFNQNILDPFFVPLHVRTFSFPATFVTTKVSNAEGMFSGVNDTSVIKFVAPAGAMNLSNASNMRSMFANCIYLLGINNDEAPQMNSKHAVDVSYMFSGCSHLVDTENINDFVNIDNARFTTYMFSSCTSLVNFNLNKEENGIYIEDAKYMMYECTSLKRVDLSNIRIWMTPTGPTGDPDEWISESQRPCYAMFGHKAGNDIYPSESVEVFIISDTWNNRMTWTYIGTDSWDEQYMWRIEEKSEDRSYVLSQIPYYDNQHLSGTFGRNVKTKTLNITTDDNYRCYGNPAIEGTGLEAFNHFNSVTLYLDPENTDNVILESESGKVQTAVPNCNETLHGQLEGWAVRHNGELVTVEAGHEYTYNIENPRDALIAFYSGDSGYAQYDTESKVLTFKFHEGNENTNKLSNEIKEWEIPVDGLFDDETSWHEIAGEATAITFDQNFKDQSYQNMSKWFKDFKLITTVQNAQYMGGKYTKNLTQLFDNCTSLETVVFPETFGAVRDMALAFQDCSSLQEVNFGGIQTDKDTGGVYCYKMFNGCTNNLNKLVFSDNWKYTDAFYESGLSEVNFTWFNDKGQRVEPSRDQIPAPIESRHGYNTYTAASNQIALQYDSTSFYVDGAIPLFNSVHTPSYFTDNCGSLIIHLDGVDGGTNYTDFNIKPFDGYRDAEWVGWSYKETNLEPNAPLKAIESADYDTPFVCVTGPQRSAVWYSYFDSALEGDVTILDYLTSDEIQVLQQTYTVQDISPDWSNWYTPFNDHSVKVIIKENLKYWTNLRSTFYWFGSYNNIKTFDGLENLNMKNVVSTERMFTNINSDGVQSLDLSAWNTSNLENTSRMFSDSPNLQYIKFIADNNVNTFVTPKLQYMEGMFFRCENLRSLNLSGFDLSKVTSLRELFAECQKLASVQFSDTDPVNCNYFDSMFSNCYSIKNLDLSFISGSYPDSYEVQFYNMFRSCSSLQLLNISNLRLETNQYDCMLYGLKNLKQICISDQFNRSLGECCIDYDWGPSRLMGTDGVVHYVYDISGPKTGGGWYYVLVAPTFKIWEPCLQDNYSDYYDIYSTFGFFNINNERQWIADEYAFCGNRVLKYRIGDDGKFWLKLEIDGVKAAETYLVPKSNSKTVGQNLEFLYWMDGKGNHLQSGLDYQVFDTDVLGSNTIKCVMDAKVLRACYIPSSRTMSFFYSKVADCPYPIQWPYCWTVSNYIYGSEFPWASVRQNIIKVNTHESCTLAPSMETMANMFTKFDLLQEFDFTNVDVSNVREAYYMFMGCQSLKTVVFDTTKTATKRQYRNLESMFAYCSSLKKLVLWNIYADEGWYEGMFQDVRNLEYISFGDSWDLRGRKLSELGLDQDCALTYWNDRTNASFTSNDIAPSSDCYGTFMTLDNKVNLGLEQVPEVEGSFTVDPTPTANPWYKPGYRELSYKVDGSNPYILHVKIEKTRCLPDQLFDITFVPAEGHTFDTASWCINGSDEPIAPSEDYIVMPQNVLRPQFHIAFTFPEFNKSKEQGTEQEEEDPQVDPVVPEEEDTAGAATALMAAAPALAFLGMRKRNCCKHAKVK